LKRPNEEAHSIGTGEDDPIEIVESPAGVGERLRLRNRFDANRWEGEHVCTERFELRYELE
jgi:hypothetical protein